MRGSVTPDRISPGRSRNQFLAIWRELPPQWPYVGTARRRGNPLDAAELKHVAHQVDNNLLLSEIGKCDTGLGDRGSFRFGRFVA
jgi:hypothetical protein